MMAGNISVSVRERPGTFLGPVAATVAARRQGVWAGPQTSVLAPLTKSRSDLTGGQPASPIRATGAGEGIGYPRRFNNTTTCPPGLRHSEPLSGFGGRRSSRRMVAGLSVAARRAAAMLTAPASRSVVVTRLRMQARTLGAFPVRARWRLVASVEVVDECRHRLPRRC